jgi:hypothetical protein
MKGAKLTVIMRVLCSYTAKTLACHAMVSWHVYSM